MTSVIKFTCICFMYVFDIILKISERNSLVPINNNANHKMIEPNIDYIGTITTYRQRLIYGEVYGVRIPYIDVYTM